MQHNGRDIGTFITTKEHRRFVEFANAVRKHRYIGLCYGPAGVGKTLSARRYAHWDSVEPYLDEWPHDHPCTSEVVDTLVRTRTLFYTPSVSETIRDMRESLGDLIYRAEYTIDERLNYDEKFCKIAKHNNSIEMIIFDESERLSMNTIEFIRSIPRLAEKPAKTACIWRPAGFGLGHDSWRLSQRRRSKGSDRARA